MTHLFTANSSHAQLNGTKVFFNEDRYHFMKGSQLLIMLQRAEDSWQFVEGELELKEAAVKLLDQYLMSQH